jgi:hypothetical protein
MDGTRVKSSEKRVLNPSSQPARKKRTGPLGGNQKSLTEALQLRVDKGGHGLHVVPVAQLPASS